MRIVHLTTEERAGDAFTKLGADRRNAGVSLADAQVSRLRSGASGETPLGQPPRTTAFRRVTRSDMIST
jgi:hypothetical protein